MLIQEFGTPITPTPDLEEFLISLVVEQVTREGEVIINLHV